MFRDQEQEIFSVLSLIFRGNDINDIKQKVQLLDVDPKMFLLWIVENIPRAYHNITDAARAYHHASKADIYLSRTVRRNNYRMWAYASNHMSLGVSTAKSHKIDYQKFSYPTWMKSRKKDVEIKKMELLVSHLSSIHHCSKKKVKQELFLYFEKLQTSDNDEIEFISDCVGNQDAQPSVMNAMDNNSNDKKPKQINKTRNAQKTLFS